MKVSELLLLLAELPKSEDVEFEVGDQRYPVHFIRQVFRDKPDYKWTAVIRSLNDGARK